MHEVNVATCFAGSGLIFAPHMDDEVLACGGTLALLPQKDRWHVVYATDGSGSPEPVIPGHDQVSPDLSAIRQDEARAALACLGIPSTNLHFLNLPDGRLRRHKRLLAQLLASQLERLQPDQILVPFRYDRHPDHLTLNQIAVKIVREGAYDVQLLEYFVYHRWRLLPAGDVRHYLPRSDLKQVNITAVSAQKRAALDCFRSQTTRFYSWQARPNLTSDMLDTVSREPELFLYYDAARPGPDVFVRRTLWIRIAHRLEPFLKKRKDRLAAYWRRGLAHV